MSSAIVVSDLLARASVALRPSPLSNEIETFLRHNRGFAVELLYPSEICGYSGETYLSFSDAETWQQALLDVAKSFVKDNPSTGVGGPSYLTVREMWSGRILRETFAEADLDAQVLVEDGKFTLMLPSNIGNMSEARS